jgi:hypothetical protein
MRPSAKSPPADVHAHIPDHRAGVAPKPRPGQPTTRPDGLAEDCLLHPGLNLGILHLDLAHHLPFHPGRVGMAIRP